VLTNIGNFKKVDKTRPHVGGGKAGELEGDRVDGNDVKEK